jgi:hypothetical protein
VSAANFCFSRDFLNPALIPLIASLFVSLFHVDPVTMHLHWSIRRDVCV